MALLQRKANDIIASHGKILAMRTTLDVDPAVLEAARNVARQTKSSLGKVISAWARQGLGMRSSIGRRKGFPIFEVPPNAEPINPEIINELMSNEGLPSRR